MNRNDFIKRLDTGQEKWDILIIGGGATGLGIAMDAAKRGYKTLLLEQADFAKGTSSRSTKLIHGGVRYLAQGNIRLVMEALHERGLLLKNAPHLVHNLSFIIPYYKRWQGPFYTIGLKWYDLLAGRLSLGKSMLLSGKTVTEKLPTVKRKGLKGGIMYHDGQFDDARLAVNMAQTAADNGATLLNYCKVTGLIKQENGVITGVVAEDKETRKHYRLFSRAVVNATGVFVDEILQMDIPLAKPIVRPSQGIHIVLDRSFLQSDYAIMIPKTSDGRVLFAVPWHHKVLVGTTDTPLPEHSLEPKALEEEIDFILKTAGAYLAREPQRKDVQSVFAGLRPLAVFRKNPNSTKEISRSHKILLAPSGLLTITGGKWTTFRRMAQDTIDKLIETAKLPAVKCTTETLKIHGHQINSRQEENTLEARDPLDIYGSDAASIRELILLQPQLGEKIHPNTDYINAQVIWAVRKEMARTVEDVLARRLRVLFLDARTAMEMAPAVAKLMAPELGKEEGWQYEQINIFTKLAGNYLLES